jgi:hypothetical protein
VDLGPLAHRGIMIQEPRSGKYGRAVRFMHQRLPHFIYLCG